MIKIKTDINQKLLQNFSNQSFPDITILTATNQYKLSLAYLIIDSQFFKALPANTTIVNLSNLPQKPLIQVLRALYGDQLIVNSVIQLQQIYEVIMKLGIEQYKKAITTQILNTNQLIQNLQILQFCSKNNLIMNQIKQIHISNNLRALQLNKNFLQLNKISLETLIPLLLEYYQQVQGNRILIINSIMQNYFNRNNIRPVDFFQKYSNVDVLRNIWQQCHHAIQLQRKPQSMKAYSAAQSQLEDIQIRKTTQLQKQTKTQFQIEKLRQKDVIINALQAQIQSQNRLMHKLQKQLMSLLSQTGKSSLSKKIIQTPILTVDDSDKLSIVQEEKGSNIKLTPALKNIASEPDPFQKQQLKKIQ